jgi:hypothetical protein
LKKPEDESKVMTSQRILIRDDKKTDAKKLT